MTWNHRVVLRRHPIPKAVLHLYPGETHQVLHGIHEVYYNEKNKPMMTTQEPVNVSSEEGLDGVKWVLDQMQKAVKAPVLDYDKDFPTEDPFSTKRQRRAKKKK